MFTMSRERRLYSFKLMIRQVIEMAVKCNSCGHVNEDESIIQRHDDGKPKFVIGKHAPFKCVKCGSNDIVSIDKK